MIREIIIENAFQNNLKNVSLRIPHYNLIVVTGISGSGKTSLIYDVIFAEGQRLLFGNFTGGRMIPPKLPRPSISRIEGLFPVIAIDRKNAVNNPRSTVGTMTDLYDYLRLLFARLGNSEIPGLHPNRSLFSFNLPDGYCPDCKGLGVQDNIDPSLLIADASKTIRGGAFVLTTPNNYIVYSQVTMDVLDQVCRAEGFNVDIPWKDMTNYQKNIVLHGSEKIRVLFGKHPLESRLRWKGITAKPRVEDYYKGIIPVMEEILHRERNPNIMRFARSGICTRCNGKRLNEKALSVKFMGHDISFFNKMTIQQIHNFFTEVHPVNKESSVLMPVSETILNRTELLLKLSNGHLSLSRGSASLNGGEAQRIHIANQVSSGLRNMIYIMDEPSAGLHPTEHYRLLEVLRHLVSNGNTVILIDHDELSIREADWIIDMGPGAGDAGGKILFNGPAESFFNEPLPESMTKKYLTEKKRVQPAIRNIQNSLFFSIENADNNNLRNISPCFPVNAFNVITGVSGSGKTSLVNFLIGNTIKNKAGGTDVFRKVIYIDSSPIGRTPKSNPATYTGLSDYVRDILAALPESHLRGYKKGQFSFVVSGGKCETCGGAGIRQIGMHFLGNVEVVCDACEGKRFTSDTLEIRYKGLNIYDILELTVKEAHTFFSGHNKITSITGVLSELGLGYLKLGQPSTTLSGGEAQRVKLATELSRSANGKTLYILDEPTTGLHMYDVEILIKTLKKLIDKGHTLLCIEHDPSFILHSDHMVDLGPGSADKGGNIVAEGHVTGLLKQNKSTTINELLKYLSGGTISARTKNLPCPDETIEAPIWLYGVETNNLKNINVSFPVGEITAITGVSGSGKSSLAYGTLHAESQRRFIEGQSSYLRQFSGKSNIAILQESRGLIRTISLQKKNPVNNPRSTVATYTGLYDLYRLLFSRMGKTPDNAARPLSTAFSFNGDEGACPQCKGLGYLPVCDPARLITNPEKPIIAGAMDGSRTGKFYGDPDGQYVATLLAACKKRGFDYSVRFDQLNEKARIIALNGCDDEVFDVEWNFKRGSRKGIHRLQTAWPGFLKLVENEYIRKHADSRGEAMLDLMNHIECSNCHGFRLKPQMLAFKINEMNIGQVTDFTSEDALKWFSCNFFTAFEDELEKKAAITFMENISLILEALVKTGLGYISTARTVGTLSGGEFQRLQLAGLVKAPLTGIIYILDEPSFGLHPKDITRIGELIHSLNNHGNGVIMIEHSGILLEKSTYSIELGPGAGFDGGQIIYSGRTRTVQNQYPFVQSRTSNMENQGKGLSINNARANNLQNISVEIPSGIMTIITGVSGSGKTSLLEKVIYTSYQERQPSFCDNISGFENFSDLIYVEQPSRGKGSNITIGKLLGISLFIAKIFTSDGKSKSRCYQASHFISGSKESCCAACEGTGFTKISMDFFNDIISPCESCNGSGFRDEILEVTIDGKTIYDILQTPINKLPGFIDTFLDLKLRPGAENILTLVEKTGLGYLAAGRSLTTLSTGELQRIKLVAGLSAMTANNTLFLLDEPTGGLNQKDIETLIILFREIIVKGNSLVCVTHEPLLLKEANKIIELGPGGGREGGRIIGITEGQ